MPRSLASYLFGSGRVHFAFPARGLARGSAVEGVGDELLGIALDAQAGPVRDGNVAADNSQRLPGNVAFQTVIGAVVGQRVGGTGGGDVDHGGGLRPQVV